ncbi:MAG: hypothetical protein RhofKO_32790 [Rhodothermales bacterium]
MPHTPPRLDEYTLSALLAGTLSEEEHQEALKLLADDASAQELVAMASMALDVETTPTRVDRTASPDRAARKPRLRRRALWTAASTCLVLFAFSLGSFINTPSTADGTEVRTLRTQDGDRFVPIISTNTLELTWDAVEDAYSYDVQIWDADRAELVGETTTKTNALKDSDAFAQELSQKLQAGRVYSLHLYATDAENRRIVQSVPTDFTYQPR